MNRGFTLPELLITASVLALLAGACFGSASETLARQRVEAASRRLEQGIEEARANAEQRRSACSLALAEAEEAWSAAADAALPRCLVVALPLGVVRIGRYGGRDGEAVSSAACLPDPGL